MQFVQTADISTNFTVGAGDGLFAVMANGGGYNLTGTISDTNGSFGAITYNNDNETDTWGYAQELSAASGTHNVTVSAGWGARILDYSQVLSASMSFSYMTNPGGTGAITGTAVTVPRGSLLVAVATNLVGSNTVSTTGTQRYQGALSSGFGGQSCVGEWAGAGGSITPAFTCSDLNSFAITQIVLTPALTPMDFRQVYVGP